MTLTKMPEVGEWVRYVGDYDGDLTEGKTYKIYRIDAEGDAVFKDDLDEDNYVVAGYLNKFELASVAEPAKPVGTIAIEDVKTVMKFREVGTESTYTVTAKVDEAGYATLQRLAAESDNQARRAVIERQIAELQRELEAL